MCRDTENIYVGLPMHPAVMFMNSNKSESNIRKIIQENRQKCSLAGIALMHECVINKGPDRDIDRTAVNILISLLMTGQYDTVVVEKMTDLTDNEEDLSEFIKDAASIGVGFWEISTARYYIYEKKRPVSNNSIPIRLEVLDTDEN